MQTTDNKQAKTPGKPVDKGGRPVKHGAYSLIVHGELPARRKYLAEYLSTAREGLIADLGPDEAALSTAQRILIDRVIGKLGVLRLLEEWVGDKGIMQDGKLVSPLQDNYLAWANSLRHDLLALGLKRAAGPGLGLAEYIQQFDAKAAVKDQEAEKPRQDGPGEANPDGPEPGDGGKP